MISVCVPTYNGARYLAVAVESILAQTLEDFELLIVDDASTDGTLEIARALAGTDQRIRVEQNPTNLGLVRNWNRCVELAKGEWIKFVFQDDFLAPTCLSRLLEAGERTRLKLVFCDREILIESGADPHLVDAFEHHLVRFGNVFPGQLVVSPRDLCRAFLERRGTNFLGEPTSALIHRSCFSRHGDFNPELVQVCDLEFWCRVGIHEGVALVNERLATFRVHAGSATTANFASSASLLRTAIDDVLLYAAFLDDPRFEPLRVSADEAESELRKSFLGAIETIEGRIAGVERANTAKALRSLWDEARSRDPRIDLLQERLVPRWQRAMRRLQVSSWVT